ncbi:hypothetical protein GSI_12332 [Ganoderma sinense ZZ0214-1]|uniref:Uncharacterized protein n=1 Tax=Ganoderma sinense ZZ0214-1 TaxID=1077348 RepID=A0A2G8RYL1_9APHY|nr:hypothetical protein GSI_12332 [Ganoderma sinense ZZ0214-1]
MLRTPHPAPRQRKAPSSRAPFKLEVLERPENQPDQRPAPDRERSHAQARHAQEEEPRPVARDGQAVRDVEIEADEVC